MQLFCVKPTVHCLDSFSEFVQVFSVGKDDLIFTETLMYEQYMQKENLACKVILKDQYGYRRNSSGSGSFPPDHCRGWRKCH